jgi:hypothetical protein
MYFSKKTVKSKQLPVGPNYAQSGHPAGQDNRMHHIILALHMHNVTGKKARNLESKLIYNQSDQMSLCKNDPKCNPTHC